MIPLPPLRSTPEGNACRLPHAGDRLPPSFEAGYSPHPDGGRLPGAFSCLFMDRTRTRKGRNHLPPRYAMTDFLAALGLVFVIEGLVFAAFPQAARRAVATMMETPDEALRLVGLLSAVLGLTVLWLVRG